MSVAISEGKRRSSFLTARAGGWRPGCLKTERVDGNRETWQDFWNEEQGLWLPRGTRQLGCAFYQPGCAAGGCVLTQSGCRLCYSGLGFCQMTEEKGDRELRVSARDHTEGGHEV